MYSQFEEGSLIDTRKVEEDTAHLRVILYKKTRNKKTARRKPKPAEVGVQLGYGIVPIYTKQNIIISARFSEQNDLLAA